MEQSGDRPLGTFVSVTRRRKVLLLVLAGAGLAGLAVIATRVPVGELAGRVRDWGPLAPVGAVLVGAALLTALVPRTPISIACGLLFGAVTGTVIALAVAATAAVVTFTIGRAVGREGMIRWGGARLSRLDRWVRRRGVTAVAAVRALPLGPYGLTGYAYGTTTVGFRDYLLGTLIAGAPSAVGYALVGATVATPGPKGVRDYLPAAFGLLVVVGTTIWHRLHPLPPEPPPPPES